MTKQAYNTGLWAEALCRFMLRLKGYGIVARRYASPLGEIDIVAVRGKMLVAVEVKARGSIDDAIQSISPRQQARIMRGAMDFLSRHPRFQNYTLRFDVMAVAPYRLPHHIIDAWRI